MRKKVFNFLIIVIFLPTIGWFLTGILSDSSRSDIIYEIGETGVLLVLAFLGGLLLNLMPCVFPILTIKILGFVQTANKGRTPNRPSVSYSNHGKKELRVHGWVFALGVLVSFWLLSGILLLLRMGGQELGWGFQLQSPGFIALLAMLMFTFGLNLMGVFEIGTRLIGMAQKAGSDSGGISGSFGSGVLATVLATPCTAPFMGTALGVAISLPALQAMLIFTALGAGLAAPYVLLSYAPGLLNKLPKPGPWMETFKKIMAFPLFATTIWLLWVFGRQVGMNGLLGLLIALLLLSKGVWVLGHWNPLVISTGKRVVTRSLAVLFFGGALYVSLEAAAYQPQDQQPVRDGEVTMETDSYGIEWEHYTEAGLQYHLGNSRRVFIDFTADWCITCKVNERNVFSSSRVRDRLKELDIVMIKADWTSQNPEITLKLAQHNRNSVPLYLLYNSADPESPEILPQILTPGIFLSALDGIKGSEK